MWRLPAALSSCGSIEAATTPPMRSGQPFADPDAARLLTGAVHAVLADPDLDAAAASPPPKRFTPTRDVPAPPLLSPRPVIPCSDAGTVGEDSVETAATPSATC